MNYYCRNFKCIIYFLKNNIPFTSNNNTGNSSILPVQTEIFLVEFLQLQWDNDRTGRMVAEMVGFSIDTGENGLPITRK